MAPIIFALLWSLLLGLSLGGCSAVRIGYGNAPSLLYWWIDGYVDFDEAQSIKARDTLAALHAWHRRQELPAYIALLQSVQTMAPANVTPEQVCVHLEVARDRLRALLANAEPGMAALVPTVKPAQIEHIRRQFEKRNEGWREKWLDGTAQQRRERRINQAVERYESFYGTLEERQLAVIRANVERSRFDPKLRYQETQRRQQETLQTLRQLLASPKTEAGAPVTTLGDSDEFRYVRTLLKPGDMEEDGLLYLSDAFMHEMVGPRVKLTERRRLVGYNHLRMIGHAPDRRIV